MAARLSEVCQWKVLLLEAGPDESPGAEIPLFSRSLIGEYSTTNLTVSHIKNGCYRYHWVLPLFQASDDAHLCLSARISAVTP